MANKPANAGAHSAGPHRGPAAAPPPVHHQDFPRAPAEPGPRPPVPAVVAWLPYLIVLAGAVAGLVVAFRGSGNAGRGAGLVGAALLVAAVARLVLPPRYAGLLVSRGKAQDVAAFAVLGAAVLGVALSLP
jgi:Protein of unknown function (DUF3017)